MGGFSGLPPGSYIRFRYHGQWDYGEVQKGGYILMFARQIPVGTLVHEGVWTGPGRTTFEPRRTFKMTTEIHQREQQERGEMPCISS